MGMEGKGWKWGGDRGDVIEREHVHCRYKSYTSSDSYSTGGLRGGRGGGGTPPPQFSKISIYNNKTAPRPHAFEKKSTPPQSESWDPGSAPAFPLATKRNTHATPSKREIFKYSQLCVHRYIYATAAL